MCEYMITISGEGLLIEQTIDKQLADKIAQTLLNERVAMSKGKPLQEELSKNTELNNKEMTNCEAELSQFIHAYNACGAAEIVTCIGLYLHKKAKLHFTKEDYHVCYKELKGRPTTNAPRELQKAINFDWIVEASPGLFTVTSKGKLAAHAKFVIDQNKKVLSSDMHRG